MNDFWLNKRSQRSSLVVVCGGR